MTPKFRGWDRKKHKMYDFMFMCFGVNLKNVFYRNQMTDFDIEMFTGELDVNGNEIYVGDIVGVYNDQFDVICFRKGTYGLQENEHHVFQPLIELDGYMELFGNIHQNEELLYLN